MMARRRAPALGALTFVLALLWGGGPGTAAPISLGPGLLFTRSGQPDQFLPSIDPADWPPEDLERLHGQLLAKARDHSAFHEAARQLEAWLPQGSGASLSSSSQAPPVPPPSGPPSRLPRLCPSVLSRLLGRRQARPQAHHQGAQGRPPLHRWAPGSHDLAHRFGRHLPLCRLRPDASTFPPSLVGISPERGMVARIWPNGEHTILAGWDKGRQAWREGSAMGNAWRRWEFFDSPEDSPMTVAVDPEGVVEFTTRRRQLYRLDREGKVRMIASWPRDPGIPFSPPSCESHSLAVAPDGTRCLGDLVSGKIFLLEERADGTTDLRPVAGNGRYHAGEEEAPDAREAGVEPADLAFGAGGDLYYVESRNNSVKRLRRDGETWSLATALRSYRPSCPVFLDWPHGCGRIPFQLTTTPEGALFVLDPLEKILHDLKAKESHSLRTLPAQVWPILCEVTAIPGGLLFLCLDGSLFHLETSDPQASCFDLAMGALAAGRSGNRLAVPEARGKLARLMAGPPSRTREHFGTLDGGPSPLEVTALCEDLLFLTDDYLWNPWQAWSAQWALWHLEVP